MSELKHILYVEDDPDISMVAELALSDLGGFELTVCASGHQALQKAALSDAQLALLDVMMPEMDGIELYKKLRDVKDIPVIFMTAKAQKHEIEELMGLGALGVISKPFDPANLAGEVQSLWGKRLQK